MLPIVALVRSQHKLVAVVFQEKVIAEMNTFKPFAYVVSTQSHVSKLVVGDRICKYGDLSIINFTTVSDIAKETRSIRKIRDRKVQIVCLRWIDVHRPCEPVYIDVVPSSDDISTKFESYDNSKSKSDLFLQVRDVDDRSPAQLAGLRVDDRIARFGGIDASTFYSVELSISGFADHHRGGKVDMLIERDGEMFNLVLSPTPISTPGYLLGCLLDPVLDGMEKDKSAFPFLSALVTVTVGLPYMGRRSASDAESKVSTFFMPKRWSVAAGLEDSLMA